MAKFDILIPAYNAEKFLRQALDSVIAQTYQDWRILLVNDGSKDGTEQIAQEYAERLGPKMRYIYQENRGLPAARNTGILNSDGELLALLDADDEWMPNRLEDSIKPFEESQEVGLSYGLLHHIDPDGAIIQTFVTPSKHAEGWLAPYIYMRSVSLPCPTVTFRRRAVEEVGLFDETMRASEDRDMWLRIALRYKVAVVRTIIGRYRISPQAMTTDPVRMFDAQMLFLNKHYGVAGCGPLQRRVALSRIYRQYGEAWATQGNVSRALRTSLKGVLQYPFDRSNLRSAFSLLVRSLKG
jgi:glycosyltransferase involved in cell wall biosynthesis